MVLATKKLDLMSRLKEVFRNRRGQIYARYNNHGGL